MGMLRKVKLCVRQWVEKLWQRGLQTELEESELWLNFFQAAVLPSNLDEHGFQNDYLSLMVHLTNVPFFPVLFN